MKEIKVVIHAQRLSKVVLALQADSAFPEIVITEIRRIGPDITPGIGGIADRLMDQTPYMKLEILCADPDVSRILRTIRRTADVGEGGSGKVHVCPVDPSES